MTQMTAMIRRTRASGAGMRRALIVAMGLASLGLGTLTADDAVPPLNAPASGERHPGKLIWGDLFSSKPDVSKRFYMRMFGWKATDLRLGEQEVSVFMLGERPIAGMVRRDRVVGDTADSRWVPYFSTKNVRALSRKITRAGGKSLVEPRRLDKRGVHAVFQDSEGAIFGLLDSASGDPPDYLADPGEWIWAQLLTRRVEPTLDFYRAFGTESAEGPKIEGRESYYLVSEGFARAGVSLAGEGAGSSGWLPFVRVESVTEAMARARRLGGKVVLKAEADSGAAVIEDPAGGRIGLLEWMPGKEEGQ